MQQKYGASRELETLEITGDTFLLDKYTDGHGVKGISLRSGS